MPERKVLFSKTKRRVKSSRGKERKIDIFIANEENWCRMEYFLWYPSLLFPILGKFMKSIVVEGMIVYFTRYWSEVITIYKRFALLRKRLWQWEILVLFSKPIHHVASTRINSPIEPTPFDTGHIMTTQLLAVFALMPSWVLSIYPEIEGHRLRVYTLPLFAAHYFEKKDTTTNIIWTGKLSGREKLLKSWCPEGKIMLRRIRSEKKLRIGNGRKCGIWKDSGKCWSRIPIWNK